MAKITQYNDIFPNISELDDLPTLVVFAVEEEDLSVQSIKLDFPQFKMRSAKDKKICEGQIIINYEAEGLLLELNSLRNYLRAYENKSLIFEHAVSQILDDVIEACNPLFASVIGKFKEENDLIVEVSADSDAYFADLDEEDDDDDEEENYFREQ